MSFLSYAQNHEDVLLWRALKDIDGGRYIDVGANDPELHSVTKAFYDRGWSGINIEPMPSYRDAFLQQRPRDINLNLAAGAADGEITLFDIPAVNGWASTDQAVADAHRAHGHDVVEHRVPLRTLAGICRDHVRGEVHFLKIDVEGFEGDVLRGMDFAACRPWIVVVEAIMPNSRDSNHQLWEALLTQHAYQFVWFDGLNRYYVAAEHAERGALLAQQPNVFDDYLSHHLDKAWTAQREQAEQGRQRGAELEQQAERAWAIAQEQGARSAELEQAVLSSQQQAAELARAIQRVEQHNAELTLAVADAIEQGERRAGALEYEVQSGLLRGTALEEQLRLSREQARELATGLRARDEQIAALDSRLHANDAWARGMEQELLAIRASNSWRLTAPLRLLTRRGEHSLLNQARQHVHGLARRAYRRLSTSAALRRTLLPVLLRFPALDARFRRLLAVVKQGPAAANALPAVPPALSELPLSTRRVLADLQRIPPSTSE